MAEDLLNALVTHNRGYTLRPNELVGALALSLANDGEAAEEMRDEVLGRDEVLEDEGLIELVLRNAEALWDGRERVADVFAAALATNPDLARGALAKVPDQYVIDLIDSADISDEGPEEGESAAEEDESGGGAIEGLAALVEAMLSEGRTAVAGAGFAKLVSLDEDDAGEAVTPLIPSFAPIGDPELARVFLNRVQHRPVSEWASWLNALDAGAVASLGGGPKALADYIRLLWRQRFNPAAGTEEADDDDFAAIASGLGLACGGDAGS